MVKKRLLVTGATGLVGKHVLAALSQEYQIYALVRSRPDICCESVLYYEFDLNSEFLPAGLPNILDGVIHLAQSSNARDFPLQARDIFNVNVKSTLLLLDYAQRAGATHFIFASTGGLYGSALNPFQEDMRVEISSGELSYYFRTKYVSENLVQAYADLMSVYILRPFFIYGRQQKSNMLFPRLIENIKVGNPITLQGENGILMNPVHVSDVVGLIKECLLLGIGSIINVAGPSIFSLREISEMLGGCLGKKPIYSQLEGEVKHIVANNEVMKNILKRPLMELQKGIVDIL